MVEHLDVDRRVDEDEDHDDEIGEKVIEQDATLEAGREKVEKLEREKKATLIQIASGIQSKAKLEQQVSTNDAPDRKWFLHASGEADHCCCT